MKFRMMHETSNRIRIRLLGERLREEEAMALQGILEKTKGIVRAKVYPATGGVSVSYRGEKADLLEALKNLDRELLSMEREEIRDLIEEMEKRELSRNNPVDFFNFRRIAEENPDEKRGEELSYPHDASYRIKMKPALKKKLRKRILIEALADAFLPAPIQTAYHAYQLITLRKF